MGACACVGVGVGSRAGLLFEEDVCVLTAARAANQQLLISVEEHGMKRSGKTIRYLVTPVSCVCLSVRYKVVLHVNEPSVTSLIHSMIVVLMARDPSTLIFLLRKSETQLYLSLYFGLFVFICYVQSICYELT